MYGRILKVYPGSLAEELELVPGDKLLEINGTRLRDIIDVSFAFADEEIEMLVEHEDGQQPSSAAIPWRKSMLLP